MGQRGGHRRTVAAVAGLGAAAAFLAGIIGALLVRQSTPDDLPEAPVQTTMPAPPMPAATPPADMDADAVPTGTGLTASSVTVDRQRRVVLVDGKPFFPLGCMGIPEGHFRQAADVGFNCTVRWGAPSWWRWINWLNDKEGDGRKAAIRQYLDKAHDSGLRVVEWPYTLDCGKRKMDLCWGNADMLENYQIFVRDKLPALIDAVKDHPALLAYYGPDEPDLHGKSQGWHDVLANAYRTIKARDPHHPVYCMFAGTIVAGWSDAYDIAGIDCYGWSDKPLGLRFSDNPRITYSRARENAGKATLLGTPYWHVPLVHFRSRGGTTRSDRIRPEEQRLQAYLALIGGAQGLIWWQWPPETRVQMDGFRKLLAELQQLAPVLVEPGQSVPVSYSSERLQIVLPVRVKPHAGHTYILAANAARFPVRAEFALPAGVAAAAKAEAVFENTDVPLAGRTFADVIPAFAVRVFRLVRPWPDGAKLGVTLRALPQEDVAPTPELARLLALESRNLVPDPAFTDPGKWKRLKRRPQDENATHEVGVDPDTNGTRLHITTSPESGSSAVYGSLCPVTLQPRARYLLAVRARRWCPGAAKAYVQLRPTNSEGIAVSGWQQWRQLRVPNLGSAAETVGATFTTGAHAFQVVVEVVAHSGANEAWFEHIVLKQLPKSTNRLRNSGFEQEGTPGEPRHWYGSDLGPAGCIGAPDSAWCLDTREAYEGRQSLCLRQTSKSKEPEWLAGTELLAAQNLRFDCPPRKDDELTLSFYAKADRPGLKLNAKFPEDAGGNVQLTTDWQRHILTRRVKRDHDRIRVELGAPKAIGTIWIDAVQLESGPDATEYEDGGW